MVLGMYWRASQMLKALNCCPVGRGRGTRGLYAVGTNMCVPSYWCDMDLSNMLLLLLLLWSVLQSVRTTGMCRVLTIPRSVYNSVAGDFGASSSVVLDNLVTQAEAVSGRHSKEAGYFYCHTDVACQSVHNLCCSWFLRNPG